MAEQLSRTNESETLETQERLSKPARTNGPLDDWQLPGDDNRMRLILALGAIVIAVISFFVMGPHFSDVQTFSKTIETLDQKKDTVLSLMGASTGSSAAISLLPGDAGTPIAEKLVDLSSDFLIVLAAIYLEKYLLTILGVTSFKILIPIACALVVGATVVWNQPTGRLALMKISAKLALFALAVFMVVPASVWVSSKIEQTYEASIAQTIQTAEQTTEAIEESANEGESTDSSNPLSFLLNMPEELNSLTESARNSLSNFIEALAVMIVTSCIIPLLVLLFFLWLAKIILGVNVDLPVRPYGLRRRL